MVSPSRTRNKKSLVPFIDYKFNTKQLAERLGVSRALLYQLENDGVIQGTRVPHGSLEKKVYGWDDVSRLSNRLQARIKKPEAKVKVFANLKGGVGKSTLATQFAMTAAASGIRTLVVDLDPQAHATQLLGVSRAEQESLPTIREAITGKPIIPAASLVLNRTPLLGLIPANLDLSSLEMEMIFLPKREERLAEIFGQLRNDWDLIIADTNPSAGMVNANAIIGADELCIVVATEFLATTGLAKQFEILKDLAERFPTPDVRIIPNLFDVREGHAQQSLGLLRQDYGDFLTNTVVRRCVDFKDAGIAAQPIWLYSRNSSGSEDILRLTDDLLGHRPTADEVAA